MVQMSKYNVTLLHIRAGAGNDRIQLSDMVDTW
jgi:hypothetical protein